jgi:hypothetical protein
VDIAPNKANPGGRGGPAIDEGLRIIDHLRWRSHASQRPLACGRCAKQTQFTPFLGWKRGYGGKQSQPGPPGAAIGDCGFGIRAGRRGASVDEMRNKANLPLLATSRESSVRDSRYEIRFTRYAPAMWTARQTNPIYPRARGPQNVREKP